MNEYLTSFKIRDTYPGRPVTMNHLLTRTAGFDKDFVGLNSATGENIAPLEGSLADLQPTRVRHREPRSPTTTTGSRSPNISSR